MSAIFANIFHKWRIPRNQKLPVVLRSYPKVPIISGVAINKWCKIDGKFNRSGRDTEKPVTVPG